MSEGEPRFSLKAPFLKWGEPGMAINLKAAGEALPERYNKLQRMIRHTSDAHSVHSDLAIAYDMMLSLPTLVEMSRRQDHQPNWASNAALAAFNSAIILYVRATKTSSNHRTAFDILKGLSSDQRASHEKMCDLRDDAIAHYGPGEGYGGPVWQWEGMYLPLDRHDDLRIMKVSRRVFQQTQLEGELTRLIHRVMLLADANLQKRDASLVAEMNKQGADQDLIEHFNLFKVSMTEIFEGNAAAAQAAMSGDRVGRNTGHMEH